MKLITSQTLLASFALSAVAIVLPSSFSDHQNQISQRAPRIEPSKIDTRQILENRDYVDEITYRDYDDSFESRDYISDLDARWSYDDDDLVYRDDYDEIFEARDYAYDLEDRDYYDAELYERGMLGMAGDAIGGIVNIVGGIKAGVAQDKDDRGAFTQKLVADTQKQHPGFNVVVCHTKHDKKFDGKEGVDWGHSHQEFTAQRIGGTTGYEIYWFKSGWFHRKGDGGYLNWAYAGNVVKNEKGGSKLTFKASK